MSFHFYVFICSIATSHAKIEWDTSMGACAQARLVHSIFIPCVPPYRTHSQSGRRPSDRYRSPSVNFLNPWIKYFSSKRARLQATSMSPTACRKHRVCSTLFFNTFQENVNTLRQTSSPWHPSTSSVHDFTR